METLTAMIIAFVIVAFGGFGWLVAIIKVTERHRQEENKKPQNIKYHVCEADYIGSLSKDVESYVQRGWKLAGGVSAADSSTGSGIHRKYIQAIYKEVGDGNE